MNIKDEASQITNVYLSIFYNHFDFKSVLIIKSFHL